MSDRLTELLTEFRIKGGVKAIEALARKMGKSPKTIDRWTKVGVSDPHKMFKLAIALGCSEKQAQAIAMEAVQSRIREPA